MGLVGRLLVAVGLVLPLTACNIAGWLAHGAPQTVPAVYDLPKKRTLILVDDQQRHLGDPALVSVIVARMGFDLTERKVLKDVVPVVDVNRVAAREGAEFAQKSAAGLARQLEAKQVIQVQVDQVTLEPSPGLAQPTARVYVKVVDASGKRLFPAANGDAASSPWGYALTVKLPQVSPGIDARAHSAALRRSLATRIGREAAALFYKHKVSPGDAAD